MAHDRTDPPYGAILNANQSEQLITVDDTRIPAIMLDGPQSRWVAAVDHAGLTILIAAHDLTPASLCLQSITDPAEPLARTGTSRRVGGFDTSANPLGQGHDDPFWPANVGHAPDVLVLTDAADQAVAVRSQPVDRRLQVVDFE